MVGASTPEEREEILDSTAEWFSRQRELREGLEQALETNERDKTAEEDEIITLVDDATNKILARHDLPPANVSPDHVHLLPLEAYKKLFPQAQRGSAVFDGPHQAILFSDTGPESRVEFALTVFHEMVHFKFWSALQVTEPGGKLQTYRSGLAVVSRDGKELALSDLNEAVTEELTGEFVDEVIQHHPLFAEEISAKGRPVRGYGKERNTYRTLLETLASKSNGAYTRAALHDLFVRAAATGHLVGVARVVEQVLGKGSFRKLIEPPRDVSGVPGMPLPRQ